MRTPRLEALGAHQPDARAEARLRQAWRFVVGPSLAERTRLLRVSRGVLVVGCWEIARVGALREAATAVWPQMRDRIRRALRLQLSGIQVVPCDPPPAEAPAAPVDSDPLRRALLRLAQRRQQRLRLGLDRE